MHFGLYCHLRFYCVTLWIRRMYAVVGLFVFMGLTATSHADHHQPCHTPNMTGLMSVMNMRGEVRAHGAFTYDSMSKKLRFRSNESFPTNTSIGLDLLMFFDEGIFYEIDSKNQSCEKKTLQCSMNPLDIPDDAKSYGSVTSGSRTIEGEGIKLNVWLGSIPGQKVAYTMCVTMGCLPLSTIYFLESTSFIISTLEVDLEIKDPDLLVVPPFCLGQPVEDTPEGTVNSFINEFL